VDFCEHFYLFPTKILRQLNDCRCEEGTLRFVVNTLEKSLNHLDKRQITYKRNVEARSHNNCRRGRSIRITYSERLCLAVVIQHGKRMSRMIL
jgi:hypothetical protein